MNIEKLDCEYFSKYLLKNGFNRDIATSFLKHKICGCTFLAMRDDDLRDILPLVGDRIRMRKFLLKVHRNNLPENEESKAASPEPKPKSRKKEMSWSFLQDVGDKLALVQNERQEMEQKAKLKATAEGWDLECINKLQWYDYTTSYVDS